VRMHEYMQRTGWSGKKLSICFQILVLLICVSVEFPWNSFCEVCVHSKECWEEGSEKINPVVEIIKTRHAIISLDLNSLSPHLAS
jgi:hypothetical protein